MAVDGEGVLYLARSGWRYSGGEAEDLGAPTGSRRAARLTPQSEPRYSSVRRCRIPRWRQSGAGASCLSPPSTGTGCVGVLHRMLAGRAELLAGGTPPRGHPPTLKQPEGAVADAAGNV